MPIIHPFENETDSFAIDSLTVENRLDRVSIYGSTDITKDQAGLKIALELQKIINATVNVLQHVPLPEKIEVVPADLVINPFGKE